MAHPLSCPPLLGGRYPRRRSYGGSHFRGGHPPPRICSLRCRTFPTFCPQPSVRPRPSPLSLPRRGGRPLRVRASPVARRLAGHTDRIGFVSYGPSVRIALLPTGTLRPPQLRPATGLQAKPRGDSHSSDPRHHHKRTSAGALARRTRPTSSRAVSRRGSAARAGAASSRVRRAAQRRPIRAASCMPLNGCAFAVASRAPARVGPVRWARAPALQRRATPRPASVRGLGTLRRGNVEVRRRAARSDSDAR
jgi:hypothetical protein